MAILLPTFILDYLTLLFFPRPKSVQDPLDYDQRFDPTNFFSYLKFVYEGVGKEFSLPITITQALYLKSRGSIDEIKGRITKKDIKKKVSDSSFDRMKEAVCEYFNIQPKDLIKTRRQTDIQQLRKILIYLARKYTP